MTFFKVPATYSYGFSSIGSYLSLLPYGDFLLQNRLLPEKASNIFFKGWKQIKKQHPVKNRKLTNLINDTVLMKLLCSAVLLMAKPTRLLRQSRAVKYFQKYGSPIMINDFSFSFYYLEISLRLRVSFFLDCLRTKDSIDKEIAPYFMTISKFQVKISSFDLVVLHSKQECWLTEHYILYLFLNCLASSFMAIYGKPIKEADNEKTTKILLSSSF